LRINLIAARMDGLAALVRESLGGDPYSGVVYVFRAKRADRVKLLLRDGTGLMLVGKRLEKMLIPRSHGSVV
jgi:transposase